MKQKMLRRAVAIALSFTLVMAVFAPVAVSADDTTVIYQLATDPAIQTVDAGTSGVGSESFVNNSLYLSTAGNPTYVAVESPFGGLGIRVEERLQNHYALDVHFSQEGFNLTDGQYTIRVRATMDEGLGFWISGADDPWRVIAEAEAVEDLGEGMFEIVHTFTLAGIGAAGGSLRGMRIAANAPAASVMTVYEIVIASGTSIPDVLPQWDAADEPEDEEPEDEEPEDEEPEDEEPEDEEPEDEEPEIGYTPLPPGVTTVQLTIGSTTAYVNGVPEVLDAAPFIGPGDRTMVPFRFIGEAMGASVDWTPGVVHFVGADLTTFELPIGEPLYGEYGYMGTPEIVNGRTMVPVRFVAERLGGDVYAALPTIIITLR